ncbi:Protein of unknown function [Gryllus bimaculatus]|nr:Protein of unknown function [Gryllus bimaculatus]
MTNAYQLYSKELHVIAVIHVLLQLGAVGEGGPRHQQAEGGAQQRGRARADGSERHAATERRRRSKNVLHRCCTRASRLAEVDGTSTQPMLKGKNTFAGNLRNSDDSIQVLLPKRTF